MQYRTILNYLDIAIPILCLKTILLLSPSRNTPSFAQPGSHTRVWLHDQDKIWPKKSNFLGPKNMGLCFYFGGGGGGGGGEGGFLLPLWLLVWQ